MRETVIDDRVQGDAVAIDILSSAAGREQQAGLQPMQRHDPAVGQATMKVAHEVQHTGRHARNDRARTRCEAHIRALAAVDGEGEMIEVYRTISRHLIGKAQVRFREREREAERIRSSRRQRTAVWLACVRRGTLRSAVSQRRGSCAEAYRRPDLPAQPSHPAPKLGLNIRPVTRNNVVGSLG